MARLLEYQGVLNVHGKEEHIASFLEAFITQAVKYQGTKHQDGWNIIEKARPYQFRFHYLIPMPLIFFSWSATAQEKRKWMMKNWGCTEDVFHSEFYKVMIPQYVRWHIAFRTNLQVPDEFLRRLSLQYPHLRFWYEFRYPLEDGKEWKGKLVVENGEIQYQVDPIPQEYWGRLAHCDLVPGDVR